MQNNDGKSLPFLNHKREKNGRKSAQEALLLCTTTSLSPRVKERLEQILSGSFDWEYFIKLAVFQGVMPLVTHNLSIGGLLSNIPRPYINQFERAYKYTVYRNVLLSNELANVVATLRNEGVETICLKGTVLAEAIYGNACLRPVTDMDILIHPEDRVKASDIVARLGYKPKNTRKDSIHPFHEEYFKEAAFTLFLELHWKLEDEQLVSFPEEKLWFRARPLDQNGIASRVLSPEDNLIFLANHLYKHNTHQLKLLCDVAELLKKYEETLDWNYIISAAHSWQVDISVYYSLKLARDLLGAPASVSVIQALKPKGYRRALLNFLFNRESFVSITSGEKIWGETLVLRRSLMMHHVQQTLALLSSYRGKGGWWTWLRTMTWIVLVFIAALFRNVSELLLSPGWIACRI